MKNILLFTFLLVIVAGSANSQQCLSSGGCTNFRNQYPTSTIYTPTTSWTTHGSMSPGNYTLFNVTSGNTYQWTYCEAYGGVSTSWDAQLTLFNNTNITTPLCFSTDVCGTKAPYISWTATFTGVARILTTQFSGSGCLTALLSTYNTLAWRQVSSSSYPDLIITTASATPSTIVAGSTTTITYSLKNQGTATAAASTTAIWLDNNNNGVFDGSPTDTWLIDQANTSIAAGVTTSYSKSVTIPSGVSGSKKIMVGCDATEAITESSDSNNQYFTSITVTAPLPDLTITTASATPSTIVAGSTTTITYSLKNQGGATASASTTAIWLDNNNNGVFDGSPTDTWLIDQANTSIAVGVTTSYSKSVTIPSGVSGSKKIMVGCDGAAVITESNESNNQYFTPITVTALLPDLIITTASATPSTIVAGSTTTIAYSLKNQGAASAASSTSAIWLDNNNNGVFDGSPTDTWLIDQVNSSIAAGATASYSVTVTIPSGISGSKKIMVGCDGAAVITESNESNNQYFTPITVSAQLPDLIITTASATPSTIVAGSTTTIAYSLKNQGAATAAASNSAIWLDNNNNGVFDGSPTDTWLTDQPNSSIAAGATASYSVTVTIPSGISGSKKIMVGCDGAEVITESTESNNQYFTPITVTASTVGTIKWSGYTWNVRSAINEGPGPNNWLANSSNVWVDTNGNLHLKIVKNGNNWYCSEIYSQQSLGYGEYTFQVSTNVENLDKNIVLGLFTYETDSKEIDIEFSRWSNSAKVDGWYTVQPPPYNSVNQSSFALNLTGDYSTHKFIWNPTEISFQSYNGHYQDLPGDTYLIKNWEYTGTNIPPVSNERVHLNLWLYNSTSPFNQQEAEVIIKSFYFKPPTITLTSPTGGESWLIGSTHNITWTSSNLTGNVNVEINGNYPTGAWEPLSMNSANNGTHSYTVDGTAGSAKRVRITSANNSAINSLSNDFAFIVPTIGIPTLTAPTNGSTVSSGTTFSLTWTAVTGATSYDVEFDSGTAYASVTNVPTYNTLSWVASASIGAHTWRVRAKNGTTAGTYSSPWTYTINALGIPTLSAPANNSTVNSGATFSLTWTAVTGATSYDVEFDSGTAYASVTNVQTYNTLSWVASASIGAHTWRVRAKNGTTAGTYSSPWTYTINALGIPTLSAPANNSIVYSGTTFSFTWTAVSGATSYDVEFDSGTAYARVTNVPTYNTLALKASTSLGSHTWHVRAKNETATGTYSSPMTYIIKSLDLDLLPLHVYPAPEDVLPLADRKPLLLIHGWQKDGMPAEPDKVMWNNFVSYFYNNGDQNLKDKFKIYRVEYYSNLVSVADLGYYLRLELDKKTEFTGKQISIVAHSMGGLVARAFMNRTVNSTKGGERVEKLITLGTPHHGTPVANGFARESALSFIEIPLIITFDQCLIANFTNYPEYFENNRSDLRWDNYDNLLDYNKYPEERNDWLEGSTMNTMNRDRTYDNKIIAYAGSFSLNDFDAVYAAGDQLIFDMFDYRFSKNEIADGIVPYVSALFDGHTIKNRRYFKGYNHSRLAVGMNGIDQVLFGTIKADLLEETPISILVSSPSQSSEYGDAVINSSIDKVFSLQNTGSSVISINGINGLSIIGTNSDQFKIISPTITIFNIGIGESQEVTVQFNPTSLGLKTANLQIPNNSDNASPIKTISLSGTGIAKTFNAPTISTTAITAIDLTGATSGGNSISDGGGTILAKGICWGNTTNPTISLPNSKTSEGAGTGTFSSRMTGLTSGSTYHVRAYATNAAGTAYGADILFVTNTNVVIPSITTNSIFDLKITEASSGGKIISDGGAAVIARGVCWSTGVNPTVANLKTSDGTGIGTFTSKISGLTAGIAYHVRSYATNSAGTAYGADVVFTTNTAIVIPTITTISVVNPKISEANSGGNIISDGGGAVISKGVCWSTSANPGITDAKTSDGTGVGAYSSTLTGLSAGFTYHVRAYATNSAGTAYGEDIVFTTPSIAVIPTLTTLSTSVNSFGAATSGGNISSDGGAIITARGVCWSTSANPTTSVTKTSDGTGIGTFTSNITGLNAGSTYHVRAYAANSAGTAYGQDITFTTPEATALPTLTTNTTTASSSTSAVSGGDITSEGGATITARGVCWSIGANPTINNSKTSDGTGLGSFTSNITSLSAGSTYHVRAYATNTAGTAYGQDITFTTPTVAVLPNLTTNVTSATSSTTASSGGNITSDGGATITVKGVCWSISTDPTTANSKTSDGTGPGIFTSSITGLTAGTTYHIRAFASNSAGTAYGQDITFTTPTVAVLPILTTITPSAITATTATSGGNITSDGGAIITAKGVCWNTNADPTVANSKTSDGLGTGTFTSSITGLTAGTNYNVRAYATNSVGTAYGQDVSFITTSDNGLTVTAGNLSTLLSATELSILTKLKLKGTIDARDFKTMRDNMPLLAEVDLSGVTIAAYSGTEGTSIWGNNDYLANAVPEFAFRIKNSLISINLPATLTSINQYAFHGCGNLNSISIPLSVESIGVSAFMNCIGITSIDIPSTVISIGEGAFRFCQCLVTVNTNNPNYLSYDGVLFNKNQTSLLYCVISKTGTYNIPLSVVSIGNYAFENCQGLTTIVLPSGLTSIGTGAFRNCSDLTSFTIPSTVTSIQSYAFENAVDLSSINSNTTSPIDISSFSNVFNNVNKSTCKLYVPFGSKTAYQSANQWKDFTNIVEIAEFKPTLSSTLTPPSICSGTILSYTPTSSTTGVTFTWTRAAVAGISNAAGSGTGNPNETLANTTSAPISVIYVYTLSVNGNSNAQNVTLAVNPTPVVTNSQTAIISTGTSPNISLTSTTPSTFTWTIGTITGGITGATAGSGTNINHVLANPGNSAAGTVQYIVTPTSTTGSCAGDPYSMTVTVNPPSTTVTDADGNIYSTVTIGTQIWMGSNLRTTKYSDGTAIPLVTDNTAWGNLTTPGYCWYENNEASNKNAYGALYNWYTVNTSKLCPIGWHVPNHDEWTTLIAYLGGENIAGGKLKETGSNHWLNPNTGATNETGFSALPGGNRSNDGKFQYIGSTGFWWSSTEYDTTTAFPRYMYYNYSGLYGNGLSYCYKGYGFSVRCVSNELTPPILSTTSISDITSNSAISGGNISSDGRATISSRGVCWSTSTDPTTANSKTSDSTGTGTFTSSITGLTPSTTYYVRAYATNSAGTAYGDCIIFTTTSENPPLSQWLQTNGPEGGGVRCLASFGSDIFAGVMGGGIYHSTNNGQNWYTANTGLTYQLGNNPNKAPDITALLINGNTIFAGSWQSEGIYISSNNGQSWAAANTGLTTTYVTALTVNGNNIFAGTYDGGVFRSSNNGQSWVAVNTGLNATDIQSLAVCGNNVYAGTYDGGIFVTTDNGQSWAAVNTGLTTTNVKALTVSGNNIFAGTWGNGIFLSTNYGQSWSPVNTGLTGFGIYSLTSNGTNIFAGSSGGGIYFSNNNGQSWSNVSMGLTMGDVNSLTISQNNVFAGISGAGIFHSANNGQNWSAVNSGIIHTDVKAFAFSGNNIFAGTSEDGIFLSTNLGQNWSTINTGLGNTSILELVVNGENIFAGTQGGGIFLSTNNGQNWSAKNSGLTDFRISSLVVDGVNIFAGTQAGGIFLSTDNGQNWSAKNSGLTDTRISSLAISGVNIFAGTYGGGIFLSTNNGQSWSEVNTGLTDKLIYSLTINGNNIFAGTWQNGVFRSTNNGLSWSAIGLNGYCITSLTSSGDDIFAGTWFESNVFWSNNDGETWSKIDAGINNTDGIESLAINGSNIFAGTFADGAWIRSLIELKSPVANAGSDQSINEGVTVTLDGSASTVSAGKTIAYKWTPPVGITLSSASVAKPTFTTPQVTANTDYTFSLVVNDGTVDSPADQVVISVKNIVVPTHFTPIWTGKGFDQMNINIYSAKLEGVELEAGDEVGIFDGTICVGVGTLISTLSQTKTLDMIVSKNDGSGNGYTVGNTISFKLYDASKTLEMANVTAVYDNTNPSWSTDGKFSVGASAFASLNGLSKVNQDISLTSGWNIISTYVVPSNLEMQTIFQPLIDAGTLKKVMDETGKTIENFGAFGGWKNNIGNLNSAKGYKVNVTSAATLSLEGTRVPLPLDMALTSGWNIISYPANTAQDAMTLVQPLIDAGKLKKVMDETGKTIENFGAFGGWKNNIGNFLTGKGYKINVTANCTLTIPASSNKSATILSEVLESLHYKKVYEGNGTDHFNVHLVNLASSGLQSGDEIGIFDGKYCVGSATIGQEQLISGSISMPASLGEDEQSGNINGFTVGHAVTLQLYRANKSYPLNFEKVSGTESFEKNGSLFAKVTAGNPSANQIEDGLDQIKCYPNPFSDQIVIEILLQKPKTLEVGIYDLSGKLIRSLYKGQAGTSQKLVWDGRNGSGAKVISGTYILKANGMIEKIVLRK